MAGRCRFLYTLLALLPACYAPHNPIDAGDGNDGMDGSSSGDSNGSTSSSATGTLSSTVSSVSDSSSAPGESSPTESSEASSSSAPGDSSTGSYPVCGDGHVDDGEECDEGDAIGPDAHCLEGCILNVCGDGELDPGIEACDDGEDANVLEVGACAPDCSRMIEEKAIVSSEVLTGGNFGNNPVAFADSKCDPGYAAMFVIDGLREASTTAFVGDGAIDWVLQPYTAYVRFDGELIWITDATALLGVRDGASQPLEMGLFGLDGYSHIITGMGTDWTSLNSNDCNGWTSSSAAYNGHNGDPSSTTDYLDNGQYDCSGWSVFDGMNWTDLTVFACVEQ